MWHRRAWVLWVFLAVACGGKTRVDGGSTDSAGASGSGAADASSGAPNAGAGTGNGNADAVNAGEGGASCPDDLPSTEPTEGAPCPRPGFSCPGYGTLTCPLTAVCSANSTWQINCGSSQALGPCSCPHHDFGRVPEAHRATAIGCSRTRAASITNADGGCLPLDGGDTCLTKNCNEDSQCDDGALGENGRCVARGPIPGFYCSYDTCFADSGCANGSVCQCRASSDSVKANYCTTPSNCRIDADCGTNGYCSPSQSHEWCGTFYACHTPDDECLNDSDCGTGSGTYCDFDVNLEHWACGNLCGPAPP